MGGAVRGRTRDIMKLSIRFLRWVFLLLYVLVVGFLIHAGLSYGTDDEWWLTLFGIGLMVGCQLIFLAGAGTIELCRPIRRRSLVVPVTIASLMMAILAGSLWLALSELLRMADESWAEHAFWCVVLCTWIGWGALFFIHCRDMERYRVIKRLTATVLAGSLVELLASVPSHIIVSRRPGCFVGMLTAMGVAGGIYVMMWAFGPGIVLLFLREKRQNELERAKREQPGPPEDMPE